MTIIEILRQYRIGEFTIFDFSTAFLGMLILSPILSWIFGKVGIKIPKKNWLFLTVPIGIITHLIIGQKTPLTSEFLDPGSHYVTKIVIAGMFILGMVGIKRIRK
jgi:hypothetical protein